MNPINFHPSDEQLRDFAAGVVEPKLALMISAHCDLCRVCTEKLFIMTQELAGESMEVHANTKGDEMALFGDMMQNIVDSPEVEPASGQELSPPLLELDGKSFILPRSLGRFGRKTQGWKKLVGKLWQAQVDLGGDARAEFIYMEKGGSVPEHTHKGNEWTLVINGEFEDGKHHYGTGDLILLDSAHTHTPVSNDPDGCLVFSIVDKPLHFTSGIARLLNPFSHLFFK